MLTSLEPKTLDPEEVQYQKDSSVVWKETTVPQASLSADHTLRTKHTVGQVVHNVHKISRVLEKSNFLRRYNEREAPSTGQEPGAPLFTQDSTRQQRHVTTAPTSLQAQLESGCPKTYGKILRYLAFESSTAFANYLRANGVNMEIQYLSDSKFLRELSKVLIDLFKYRIAVAPEQFIQKGFTERKMVLVLDLYDLIKQVRKMAKVGNRLTMKDTKWEHPCDQPIKHYQVIDHSRGVAKRMQFNMNACLLTSDVSCQDARLMSTTSTAKESAIKGSNAEAIVADASNDRLCCGKAASGQDRQAVEVFALEKDQVRTKAEKDAQSIYSVSRHYKQAMGKRQEDRNRGEKMGTSKVATDTAVQGVISEANERSEESKSIVQTRQALARDENQDSKVVRETSINTRAELVQREVAESREAAQVVVANGSVEDDNDEQMQVMLALTQTISQLGGRFEELGQSFEQKLAKIEEQHRELERRLAETTHQVGAP